MNRSALKSARGSLLMKCHHVPPCMRLLLLYCLCCALTLHCPSLPCVAHPDGTLEYNVHNLYGTSMARHFHNTYRDITGKRVFLLTRYACTCSFVVVLPLNGYCTCHLGTTCMHS